MEQMIQLMKLPIEQRLALHEKASSLRKAGFGSRVIARELQISRSTVTYWLKGSKPRANVAWRVDFNDPDFTYLIGAMIGDGTVQSSVTKKNSGLSFSVKDKDFAEKVAGTASRILGRAQAPLGIRMNKAGLWRVRFGSKELANYLRSRSWMLDAFDTKFMRAFADAEGCVAINRNAMRKSHITIANTDLELLMKFQEKLDALHIHSIIKPLKASRFTKNPCYHLDIGRKQSIINYAQTVGFSIERKRQKLDNLLAWIRQHGDQVRWIR